MRSAVSSNHKENIRFYIHTHTYVNSYFPIDRNSKTTFLYLLWSRSFPSVKPGKIFLNFPSPPSELIHDYYSDVKHPHNEQRQPSGISQVTSGPQKCDLQVVDVGASHEV